MTRTILIPDLGGASADHWQAWWARVEPDALLLHGAVVGGPSVATARVVDTVLANPGSVIVAHGSGCLLATKVLTEMAQLHVAGALLVAPSGRGQSDRLGRLADGSQDALPVATTVVASRTDPWTGIAEAERIAEAWDGRFVDLGDAGHIDAASGFGPWHEGIALRDDLIVRAIPSVLPGQVRDLPAQRWAF